MILLQKMGQLLTIPFCYCTRYVVHPKRICTTIFAAIVVSICITSAAASTVVALDTLPPEIYVCNTTLNAIVYGDSGFGDSYAPPNLAWGSGAIEASEPTVGEEEPPPGIDQVQSEYLSQNSHYWQGLVTHDTIPSVDVPLPPDPTRHPSDQAESWSTVGIDLPAEMEIAVSVNVYNAPCGQGYFVLASTMIDEQQWERSINVGCESWHEYYWQPVQEP